MIKESSSQPSVDSDVSILSRPTRHDKWKRARQRPSGEYTSEVTQTVARRIVSNSKQIMLM